MKGVITERDIIDTWKKRKSELIIPETAILTPAAQDAARSHRIAIKRSSIDSDTNQPSQQPTSSKSQSIVIGSDHGGYELKETLVVFLRGKGFFVEDVGTFSVDSVDYPDFAAIVAEKVARNLTLVGILVDGAGVGSAMTANKVPGIRAAACYDPYTARNSREHNYANVLTLGSRVTDSETAQEIVETWLSTPYGEARHGRRVEKITKLERKYLRD